MSALGADILFHLLARIDNQCKGCFPTTRNEDVALRCGALRNVALPEKSTKRFLTCVKMFAELALRYVSLEIGP